jgi:Spy/CpxP family protein refolding chaperone
MEETMKRKMFFSIVVMALLALVAACGHRPCTPEQRAERMVAHLTKKLDLSATQQQKLEGIKQEFLAKLAAGRAVHEEVHNELIAQLKKEQPDKQALDAVVAKCQQHANEMIAFFGAKLSEFHAILTPEQRAKLVQIIAEHHDKRK